MRALVDTIAMKISLLSPSSDPMTEFLSRRTARFHRSVACFSSVVESTLVAMLCELVCRVLMWLCKSACKTVMVLAAIWDIESEEASRDGSALRKAVAN
jgi:hypothetical protein